ncbi:MAG TPA: hypothetical protein VJB57_19265 [Dehalococcoidia bacterium]|nr:hypothetical protein [Dehalococcoidia bacterium]
MTLALTVARSAAFRLWQAREAGQELTVALLETVLQESLEQAEAERIFRARRGLPEEKEG